jgi:hypothetical protein
LPEYEGGTLINAKLRAAPLAISLGYGKALPPEQPALAALKELSFSEYKLDE